MNLCAMLRRAAGIDRWRSAVLHGEVVTWRYGELYRRAASLATALRSRLGLRIGDRVALAMSNRPQYVEILFGCWYAGLVAVPVNARLHPRELAYIFEHSGAALCFVSPDLELTVGDAVASTASPPEVISIEGGDYRALVCGEPGIEMTDTSLDDVAWLFYTSGTTGRPKGAMLSHGNLRAMAMSYLCDVDTIGAGDCILHAAPMSHGSGLYIVPHVASAAANLVPESTGFHPDEVIRLIGRHAGVTLFLAPTMVGRLIDHDELAGLDLDRLKTVVYGGGPMYLADLDRAHERLGYRLAQIYGQGESPMTITALSKAMHADSAHPRYRERLASVGISHTAVEVRIVDGEGRTLPSGECGEVVVRGDTVMRGYWRSPKATAGTIRAGWLHTGDLGRLDEDGFLTLTDRARDLIISGGSNVYPREVEEVLLMHDEVTEVAVVGRPDPEWGETPVAFVITRRGAAVAADELSRHCLAHMARYKRPREYRFVDELPKNSYGKVLKTELRRRLFAEDDDRLDPKGARRQR